MAKIKFSLILSFICFIVYFNALSADFVSDDTTLIRDEQKISSFENTWKNFPSLLYTVGYKIGGLKPFWHHLISILIHIGAVLLTFKFLKEFFPEIPAFLASALFSVLPVHVENVTWISGRHYILAYIVTLSCLFFYKKYIETDNFLYYIKIMIIYFFGLFNLSSWLLSLPVFLIIFDFIYNKKKEVFNYAFPIGMILLSVYLSYGAITARIHDYIRIAPNQNTILPNIFLIFCYSFVENMKLVIFPTGLTLYHEPAMINIMLLTIWCIFVVSLILLSYKIFKFSKHLFFWIMISAIFLSPAYTPKPICWMVDERYNYLPSLAYCVFIAVLYQKYSKKWGEITIWIFLFMFFIYSSVTIVRNQDYRTEKNFWEATAKNSPLSPRAHNNLGEAFLKEGNYIRAEYEFKKATELNPEYLYGWHNLGATYQMMGKYNWARVCYKKALSINPKQYETQQMLQSLPHEMP